MAQNSIEKLINIFRKFPAVGPRTAGRFVYYLMGQPKEKIDELISAIQEIKNKIKFCEFCFNPFESFDSAQNNTLCPICADPRRDKNLLCVVEKEVDLESIEKTKRFNGLFFILNINSPRLEELRQRIKNKQFSEIIIALNPTQEGKAAAVLTERALKEIGYSGKITHLAQGIPAGGELEYADEETLESALSGRK